LKSLINSFQRGSLRSSANSIVLPLGVVAVAVVTPVLAPLEGGKKEKEEDVEG
jgi:hypothetical protein